MKMAIVCDDLIQMGGQEKLVMGLFDVWPDAVLHASVISSEWAKILKSSNIAYQFTFMQRLPFVEKLYRFYSLLLLHVFAFELMDLKDFDVILSVSSRYAHFVVTGSSKKHICYMNTPGRMFWETKDYFVDEKLTGVKFLNEFLLGLIQPILSVIRLLDFGAAHRVDYFIANSETSRARIDKYYRRDSAVIYPFHDLEPAGITYSEGDYFLVISRLLAWKKIDIAIQACNDLGLQLKVIGDGPDYKRLKKLSGPTIEMLGYVGDIEKTKYLLGCKALINTQREDFGIVPLEAMACGKPVIAFAEGGATETVLDGVTGIFFTEQTSSSLSKALNSFEAGKYDPKKCIDRSMEFSKLVFVDKIKEFVELS